MASIYSSNRLEKAQVLINGAFAIIEKIGSADNTYQLPINGIVTSQCALALIAH